MVFCAFKVSTLRNCITTNIFCPRMAQTPLSLKEVVWAFLPCQAHDICHPPHWFIPLRLCCTLSASHKLQTWKMIHLQKLFLRNRQWKKSSVWAWVPSAFLREKDCRIFSTEVFQYVHLWSSESTGGKNMCKIRSLKHFFSPECYLICLGSLRVRI